MRKLHSIYNLFKLVGDALIARTRNKLVSLQFGSHREEFRLTGYVEEFVVESSSDQVICVKDPIIADYAHRHVFNDRAICRLRGATFDSGSGNVYLGKLLVRESHSDTSNLPIRKSSVLRRISDHPVIGVPYQTHYHWLIETLPRIIAAAKFESKAILVAPTRMSQNQRKAIEILGHEVRYSDARHSCDNLILATRGQDSGWAHPLDLDTLRRTYSVPAASGSLRLFVSRVGGRRSDVMSQTIHDFALKSGWTVIRAEELTWEETLKLFGEASIIAGEHGAGLANLALSPLATQLIELQRSNYVNPCFAALSQALNRNSSNYSSFPLDQYKKALALSSTH